MTAERRYWDSCNFISLVAEDEVERAEICQRVLEDTEKGDVGIITSALTIAEVVKPKGSPAFTAAKEQTIASFFEHRYILIHDVTRIIGEASRRLSREHGLKPRDAIHLATALLAGADVFESWNTRDFFPLRGVVPIEIREPMWVGTLPAPLEPDDGDWGTLPGPFPM